MCGLAGIVCPNPAASWDLALARDAMVASIRHRGPDDHGQWTDADTGVYLGFRRLSIIDLSEAGHQPMSSPSGRYVILFNGEIYNHEAIRADLRGAHDRFRGHSDTEVLVAAFEHWGVHSTLAKLRGMFAIALWDRETEELWLVRDRMGIKPLYVLHSDRGVAFASEARAFHECPLYDGGVDPAAARQFLQRLYVSGPPSILDGVQRVAPGELRRFQLRTGAVRQVARETYWDLLDVARRGSESLIADPDEVAERFHDVLREAVRLRLYADVPIGAFLSGGIDSTAVVGMMQELSSEPVRTFTVGFEDAGFDESTIAADTAQRIGTRHTRVSVSSGELLQLVSDLPGVSDEPMANPSIIPTIAVSRIARRDVTVALSGDGGDECFGGYNRYLGGERLIQLRNRLPAGLRSPLARALRASAVSPGSRSVLRRMGGAQHTMADRALKVSRIIGAETEVEAYETLLDIGWIRREGGVPSAHRRAIQALAADSPDRLVSRMMLHDQLEYLPDDLLTKVDRASMWESLEARVPLLDHEVVSLSWRVAPRLKIRDGKTKWPIRQIAARYVPESWLDRPKMGFTVPIARWLREDLREWASDTLEDASTHGRGIFEPAELRRTWSQFDRGRSDLALGIWAVLVLQTWATEWGVSLDS